MRLAFFDFDGTLIRRESGVICAVPSIRRGLLAHCTLQPEALNEAKRVTLERRGHEG